MQRSPQMVRNNCAVKKKLMVRSDCNDASGANPTKIATAKE